MVRQSILYAGSRASQLHIVLSQLATGNLTGSCRVAHLLDVRKESNFQFIGITAQHIAGCSFLLEHTGSDADLAVPVI